MNIYLSGPVTGLDHSKATKAFNDAETKLRSMCPTATIFNPMKHVPEEYDGDYPRAMQVCLTALSSPDKPIDVVVQLPNWKHSRGAMLEASIANTLDIPCITINSQRLAKVLNTAQDESEKSFYTVHVEIDKCIHGTVTIAAKNAEDACYFAEMQYNDINDLTDALDIEETEIIGLRFRA